MRRRSASWPCGVAGPGSTRTSRTVPAEPYASQLAGEWERAVAFWDEAGCPYEAALARADSGDESQLRRAFDELQGLAARPAAAIVAGR